MKKKKRLFTVLMFLFPLLIIFLFIGFIRYFSLSGEMERVDLPEIVFEYVVKQTNDSRVSRVIDKNGDVYEYDKYLSSSELVVLYQEGRMQERCKHVGKVDINSLKSSYMLFINLQENEYKVISPDVSPDGFAVKYLWWGYYYNADNEIDKELIYVSHFADYKVTDKRGKKLAEWIEKNVRDD